MRSVNIGADGRARCWWCGNDPTYIAYHDDEWGRPLHDDRRLYGLLVLEGFQAGLSWITILRKRPAFERAFAGFDPEVVAGFGPADMDRLLGDAGIIRHRGKCEAAITNAQATLDLWEAGETLDGLCRTFSSSARPRRLRADDDFPALTPESTALAKELRRRGFRFIGPTVAYAHLQSAGFVDDHLEGCWVPAPPPPRPASG
ncbi:MAG: DNA-3-methyladenine glycosylase I [Acidimicrobiales bacterium]